MVSIQYPSRPSAPDLGGFERGLAGLGDVLEERKARKALDAFAETLYGGQGGGEMSLASLQPPPQQQAAPDMASQRVAQAHSASGGTPPGGAIEAYIRHAAQKRGIDPEIAVKVAMSEGGVTDPTRQSDVVKDGVREQSYGPFQLYMNGGLGNEAMAAGIDPRKDWQAGIDFALDKAKQGGWGPWYGAAKAGIGERDGIGGSQSAMTGGGGSPGVQMAQSAPAGNGGGLLPPREVMQQLLRNKQTRPLGIALAQEAIKARQGDPEAALKVEKLRLEVDQLRNPTGKPTDDMREYEFAKQQGFGGSFVDFQLAQKKAGATSVNVGTGEPGDGELRKSLDKSEGDLWSTYKQIGSVSGAAQQDFAVLDELIKVAPQGPITGRLAEAFPGVSSAGDAFQSIVKRIAPTLRAPGSGATSDIEYDGMLRSLPALRNNPDANVLINQIMKEKAALNVQRSEIITRYQTNEISAADARKQLSDLDKVSIISPEMKRALGIVGSGGKGNRTSSGIEWSIDD